MKHERAAALDLYASHRAELVEYAAGIVGNRARAEDIVQDAWLMLDRRADDATPIQDFRSYLRRTVRNLAIDSLRRSARDARVGGGDIEVATQIVADPQPSAEAALMARQELAGVLDVLATLPERQRRAIELYRFQELTLREVAERLGISLSLAHLLVVEGLALCAARRKKGRGNRS